MSDALQDRIIEKIQVNRISTTEVADALGKTGLYPGAHALNRGLHRVGPVFWTYAYGGSNYELHEQLRDVPAGSVVISEKTDCGEAALFGSLVSKFILLYRRACAIVSDGLLRDTPHLIKESWPIWCAGTTPIGCVNVKNAAPYDPDWVKERRAYFDGAIAVCDDSGVVVIEKSKQTEAFLDRLDFIEEQEDMWFTCIDTLKWDTFRTVCQKEYKDDPDLQALAKRLKDTP